MAKRKITGDLAKTLKNIQSNKEQKEKGDYKFDPVRQIEGIERRLESSGIDAEKVKDERSPIEKLLNLPDDQNILFDFFEVMNRPQNAAFNALKAVVSPDEKNIGKALLDGISGKEKTQFKDVLHEMDMEKTEGYLGADDILGIAGDVFLDPMNYVIPGSSAAAKFTKTGLDDAIKAADKASDALKAAEIGAATVFEQVETMSKYLDSSIDYVESIDHLNKSYKTVTENARQASLLADEDLAKALIKKSKLSTRDLTVRQLATQKLGSGFKGMFVKADSGVTKLFNWFDEAYEAKGLAKATAEGTDSRYKPLAKGYQGFKESLTRTFDMKRLLPEGFYNKYRTIKGKQAYTEQELALLVNTHLDGIDRDMDTLLDNIIKSGNGNINKDRLKQLVNIIYEYNVIGKDGTVNLSNITLSNKDVKIVDVLTQKHRMFDSGFSNKDKEAIELFVETFMPKWYRINVLGDKGLKSGMFIQGNGGELTGATWRLARPEWINPDLDNQTFIKELNALGKLDTKKRMAKYLKSYHNIDLDDSGYRQYHEYNRIKTEAVRLQKQLEAGKTTILKEDSLLFKEFLTQSQRYKDVVEEMTILENKINDHTSEMGDILELWGKYEEKANQLETLKAENARLIELYNNDKIPIETILNNLNKDLARREKILDKGILKFIDGFLGGKEGTINLSTTLNDRTIKDIEFLINNLFDDVNNVTTGMHTAMTTVAKTITDVFGTAYFTDVFTEDYFRHTVTSEWLDNQFRRIDASLLGKTRNEAKKASDLIGNRAAYEARRWKDPAAIANEQVQGYIEWLERVDIAKSEEFKKSLKDIKNLQLFETDIRKSILDHVATSTKTTRDALVYRHVLESIFLVPEETFAETGKNMRNLVITMEDTKDVVIPKGFVAVESRAIAEKARDLLKYSKMVGEKDIDMVQLNERIKLWLEKTEGKRIFIDKNIDRMIGRMTDKVEQGSFLSFMDSLNRVFKRYKLLSPGFVFRSSIGNYSNMWLAGMDASDIAKYSGSAYKDFKLAQKISEKVVAGLPVTEAERAAVNLYNEFMQHGFGDVGHKVRGMEDVLRPKFTDYTPETKHLPQHILSKPKEVVDKFIEFNYTKNGDMELMQRFTLYKYAKENPQWLLESEYGDAADAVRQILYDYTDLSATEQDVMKRLIPFYTFTKKNLGFQFQNMMKNTSRYSDLIKTYNGLWDALDLDENELDNYKKESFWTPIPIQKDGKYMALKSALPIGDLGQFLSNPPKSIAASTAPIIRAPFEVATNRQAFSGMPISEFKGQKGYQIPELTRKGEYALNQLGLDVPVSGIMNFLRTGKNVATGDITSVKDALYQGLGKSLASEGDANVTSERKAYDQLDSMQNLLRYYKQEGIEVMTLTEINNREKFNNIESRIQRLRAIRNRKR